MYIQYIAFEALKKGNKHKLRTQSWLSYRKRYNGKPYSMLLQKYKASTFIVAVSTPNVPSP